MTTANKWLTDITYLTLGNKRMCLSTILDLYVNDVFDWIWFYKTERISLSERQHNINENIC